VSHLTLNLPTLTDDVLLELAQLVSQEVAQREHLDTAFLEIAQRSLVSRFDHFWADQSEVSPERLDVQRALKNLYPDLHCRVRATWFLEHGEVSITHANALINVRYQVQARVESLECAGSSFTEGSRERELLLQICRAAAVQARLVVKASRSRQRKPQPNPVGETKRNSSRDSSRTPKRDPSRDPKRDPNRAAWQKGQSTSSLIEDLPLYAFIPLPNDPRYLASLLTPVTALAVLGRGERLALIHVSASNGGWSFAKRPIVLWVRGQVNATLEAILPGQQASIERLVQGKPPSMAALKKRFAGFKGQPLSAVFGLAESLPMPLGRETALT
jgi:hypothetical protein